MASLILRASRFWAFAAPALQILLVRERAPELSVEFSPAQPGRLPDEAQVAAEARDPRLPLDLGDDVQRVQVGARHEDAIHARVPLGQSDGRAADALRGDAGHLEQSSLL